MAENGDKSDGISPPPNLPRRITHPGLPQGKEQVTPPIVISPHLASPVGEGQIPLAFDYCL